MTPRVSMLLKSRTSLLCLRAGFLPDRAKDLSASRQKEVPQQDVTNQLAFLPFIAYRIFLPPLTFCSTSLFLTRSVQMISIFLQHHISKLSRSFRSAFPSVQVTPRHKTVLNVALFDFFLKFKPSLLIKTVLFLLNVTFSMAILDIISYLRFASFGILVPKELKYFQNLQLFWTYHNL